MANAPIVKTNIWFNYANGPFHGKLWTVTHGPYTTVQQIIGILFAGAFMSLSSMVVRAIKLRAYRSTDGEHSRLLGQDSTPAGYGTTAEGEGNQTNAASARSSNEEPGRPFSTPQQKLLDKAFAIQTLFTRVVCLVLALGSAVGAGFFATASVPATGLSASNPCGVYSLSPTASDREIDDDAEIQAGKESRAGQYARDCYDRTQSVDPGRCSFFAQSIDPHRCSFFDNGTLRYNTKLNQDCPFANSSICAQPHMAVEFSTGPLDASLLGINSAVVPTFQRRTVCSPLTMSPEYIKNVSTTSEPYKWEYHFGPTDDARTTFLQRGDPLKWLIPAYRVNVVVASPYEDHDYWTPIPALGRPSHTFLTLMFIESCRIFYAGSSDDYIFPARDRHPQYSDLYYNRDRKAKPLACVDWLEVCQSDGTCRHIDEESDPHEVEYEFVRAAMRKSTIFEAIKFRLGSALLAQECVSDLVSKRLSDHQWILESAALFETSLSRIQHDVLDIAVGFGHEKAPGLYVEETLGWAKGKMCGMYRFNLPAGYWNVSFWPNLLTAVILIMVSLLGLPTLMKYDDVQKGEAVGGNMKVIEWLCWLVYRVWTRDWKRYWNITIDGIGSAGRFVASTIKSLSSPTKRSNGRQPGNSSSPRSAEASNENGRPVPTRVRTRTAVTGTTVENGHPAVYRALSSSQQSAEQHDDTTRDIGQSEEQHPSVPG